MRILVACEFSGRVRDAFISKGHYAISCDLVQSEVPGPHIRGDIHSIDMGGFDLLLGFPPCTYLASSGACRWNSSNAIYQREALELVRWLLSRPVDRIAIENPVGIISTRIAKPAQIIQPWQYGDPYTKATCLWLKGLPPLKPGRIVAPLGSGPHSPAMDCGDRRRNRSRTYLGIAEAMADQWGVS